MAGGAQDARPTTVLAVAMEAVSSTSKIFGIVDSLAAAELPKRELACLFFTASEPLSLS
jgi:hypothetical protein